MERNDGLIWEIEVSLGSGGVSLAWEALSGRSCISLLVCTWGALLVREGVEDGVEDGVENGVSSRSGKRLGG